MKETNVRGYLQEVFYKMKGKRQDKNSNFMNYNLSSLCMVAVSINLTLHRDVIKIQ